MKRPAKAILLAAGLGTRMRPISSDLPKPMMPLWGKPAIGHMIDLLRSWGVRQILVNLHHEPDPIVQYLRKRDASGVEICFSFEPEILGTGGALKKAAWFIRNGTDGFDENSAFWVVNSDIAADVSSRPFLQAFHAGHPLAVLWLHPMLGPQTVEMSDGIISGFHSNTPGADGTYTFCGLQLVSTELMKYFPRENSFSIIDVYKTAMSKGGRVCGVTARNAFWADLGSPEQYLEGHRSVLAWYGVGARGGRLLDPSRLKTVRSLRRRGVIVDGFVSVGEGTAIAAGARIRDSVIWDGARISAGARLNGAIVGRNTCVRGKTEGMAIRCDHAGQWRVLRLALEKLQWPEAETTALPLGARGSARSFTRLNRRNKTVILMHYSPEREENLLYSQHARFLRKAGFRVPEILADMPGDCALIAEDLGDCTLESMAKSLSENRLETLYKAVLDSLLTLHRIPPAEVEKCKIRLQPPFSSKLYLWERELMAHHLLRRRPGLDARTVRGVMEDLETVAQHLLKAPHVLIHRDMQSSNILLQRGWVPAFVDFQGMRFGPAAYDLASLLCDPYVMLSPAIQDRLMDYYMVACGRPRDISDIFWFAAVERLAQALGAFARISAEYETRRFARHIEPALAMMDRALNHLDGLPRLRHLANCGRFAVGGARTGIRG